MCDGHTRTTRQAQSGSMKSSVLRQPDCARLHLECVFRRIVITDSTAS
jgi:hypothetical protein